MAPPPITGTTEVDFLRSTTTRTTHRESDGDTAAHVQHVARFGVRPGSVEDLLVPHGRRKAAFQPRWVEVGWFGGELREVKLSGPQRLLSSDLSESTSKHTYWWGTARTPLERATLPQVVRDAIVNYERAVMVESTGALRGDDQ